ncbi:hypothetical protein K402DRAFT_321000 [Aulographum hederae CBS 113979]|uniref:DUF7707 domain-containing protein n=1 Tax=Aulographum hederae CBS 113979 TaxID=1176131 RepID=A0A6G1HHQ7_9PEZI|nr:hypothetical protein K402DRAFT_321000 [Aulographum hederae CBS 113979]
MLAAALFPVILAFAGLSFSQTVDPESIPQNTRDYWCQSQKTQCPLLCLQLPGESAATVSNTCDSDTLQWSCVCANGQTPSVANYSLTMPYFECTEFATQCVANCGSNNACSASCRNDHPCGAQNPVRINSTSSSAEPSSTQGTATGTGSQATATSDDTGSGFGETGSSGSSDNPESTSSPSSEEGSGSGAAMLDIGRSYGLATLAAGLFTGFAFML